jgi:hypothetical protein
VTSTLIAKTLLRADHSCSFQILAAHPAGWEATEQRDRDVIQQQHYEDWHRVERALARFRREIDELRDQGWREV